MKINNKILVLSTLLIIFLNTSVNEIGLVKEGKPGEFSQSSSPPEPRIINPVDGSIVNGNVTIEAIELHGAPDIVWAFFEHSMSEVWLEIANDTDGSDGWNATWGTIEVVDGDYSIRVNMSDVEGDYGLDTVEVYVNNDMPDPWIANPSNSSTLYGPNPVIYGNITEIWAVDSNLGVDINSTLFEYSLDGENWTAIGIDTYGGFESGFVNATNGPGYTGWNMTWNTTGFGEGVYHLRITMTDKSGQMAQCQQGVYYDPTPSIPEIYEPSVDDAICGMVDFKVNTVDENVVRMGLEYYSDIEDEKEQEGIEKEKQENVGPTHPRKGNMYCGPTAAKMALSRLAKKDERLRKVPKRWKKKYEKWFRRHHKRMGGKKKDFDLDKYIEKKDGEWYLKNLGLAVVLSEMMKTRKGGGTSNDDLMKGIKELLKKHGVLREYTYGRGTTTRWVDQNKVRVKPQDWSLDDYRKYLKSDEAIIICITAWEDRERGYLSGNGHYLTGRSYGKLSGDAYEVDFVDPETGEVIKTKWYRKKHWGVNEVEYKGKRWVVTEIYIISPKKKSGGWSVIGEDTDGNDGWSVSWNTATVPHGYYLLSATIVDSTNNTGVDYTTVYYPRGGYGPTKDLHIYFYDTCEATYPALKTGEIDIMAQSLTAAQYEDAVTDPNIVLTPARENRLYQFDFNNNETISTYRAVTSPMSYLEFRRAIAHLVDKDYIVDVICGGFAERIDVPVPVLQKGWWNESVIGSNYPYPYNPLEAAAKLDAAGFVQGTTPNPYYDPAFPGSAEHIRTYPTDHPQKPGYDLDPVIVCCRSDHLATLDAGRHLYENMRKHGIPVDPIEAPRAVLSPKVMGCRDYHIYTGEWTVGRFPTHLYRMFHSNYWFAHGPNYVLPPSKIPDYDYSLERVWYATSIPEAIDAAKRCQGILVDNAVSVWLYSPKSFYAYKKGLQGIVNMDGYGPINQYTIMNAYKPDCTPNRIGSKTPSALNILYATTDEDIQCLNQIYSHLMSVAPYDLTADQPSVAQDWHVGTWTDPSTSEIKTKLTFWLRKDVYWVEPSTGTLGPLLTAYDVDFTIYYIQSYSDCWLYGYVKDVHHTNVIDEHSIEIYINASSCWALYWIGEYITILPQHVWEGIENPRGYTPGDLPWQESLVGCGQFYVADAMPGVGGLFFCKANRNFFLENPPLAEIDWRWKWGQVDEGRRVDSERAPRTGRYRIEIYDVVLACVAYGSTGTAIPDPNWFAGADLKAPGGKIDIYDVVTICGKYGMGFGHPPLGS